jgi:myo-inositol-1(or 4)-monophosphatase
VTDDELLDVALEAARTAGDLLLARFGTERALAAKSSPTDLVSDADLAAEAAIRDVLARRAPDDGILGEEGDDVEGTSGRRWVVDPLDGTVNFLYGIPQWCVSVACEGHAGVVLDPCRDEAFTATADGPARLADRVLEGPAPRDGLGGSLVATGFGYREATRARQAPIAARVLPHVRDLRRAGAAALDLAWVAAGRLDAYWEFGVQPWDTAAGELLCAAVGVELHRLPGDGGDLPPGILAAPPALAGELRALVLG